MEDKGSVIFRSASEATPEVEAKKPEPMATNVKQPVGDSKVDVPVALYADLKGLPYSAKYFEVEGIWNEQNSLKNDLEMIDKAYRHKVQHNELADGKKSYESFIKEAEKVTGSSLSPLHVRISKIAAYVSFMAGLEAIDKKHGK